MQTFCKLVQFDANLWAVLYQVVGRKISNWFASLPIVSWNHFPFFCTPSEQGLISAPDFRDLILLLWPQGRSLWNSNYAFVCIDNQILNFFFSDGEPTAFLLTTLPIFHTLTSQRDTGRSASALQNGEILYKFLWSICISSIGTKLFTDPDWGSKNR